MPVVLCASPSVLARAALVVGAAQPRGRLGPLRALKAGRARARVAGHVGEAVRHQQRLPGAGKGAHARLRVEAVVVARQRARRAADELAEKARAAYSSKLAAHPGEPGDGGGANGGRRHARAMPRL